MLPAPAIRIGDPKDFFSLSHVYMSYTSISSHTVHDSTVVPCLRSPGFVVQLVPAPALSLGATSDDNPDDNHSPSPSRSPRGDRALASVLVTDIDTAAEVHTQTAIPLLPNSSIGISGCICVSGVQGVPEGSGRASGHIPGLRQTHTMH